MLSLRLKNKQSNNKMWGEIKILVIGGYNHPCQDIAETSFSSLWKLSAAQGSSKTASCGISQHTKFSELNMAGLSTLAF